MPSEYQLTQSPRTVKRVADEAYIPDDPANRDWQTFLAWEADGGVPDPALVIPPPTAISSAEFFARFTEAELIAMHTEAWTSADVAVGITLHTAATSIELAPVARSAALTSWMDQLVTAGCITSQRRAEIMRPPEPATILPA